MGDWVDGRWVGTGWPQTAPPRQAGTAVDDGLSALERMDNGQPQEPSVELQAGLAEGVTITLPDEPPLHTRKLLKTLGAGFRVDPAAPGSCDHSPPAAPAEPAPRRAARPPKPAAPMPGRKPKTKHNKRTVIADIHALARRLGRQPIQNDDRALTQRARKYWGCWGNAMVAAGYERPTRAHRLPPKAPDVEAALVEPAPQVDGPTQEEAETAAAGPPPAKAENVTPAPLLELVDLGIRFLTDVRELLARSVV